MNSDNTASPRSTPLRLRIDDGPTGGLPRPAALYALETLAVTAGLAVRVLEEGEADIVYGPEPRQLAANGVFLRRQPIPAKASEDAAVIWHGKHAFLYFDGAAPAAPAREDGRLYIDADIVLATFLLLSGALEEGAQSDRHGCHHVLDLALYKLGMLHHAPVNHYADLLQGALGKPSTDKTQHYVAALSHDVDYPEIIRWIEMARLTSQRRGRVTMREMGNILTGRSHFWQFGEWMELERSLGFRSAFYFCGYAGSLPGYALRAPDPFYDVAMPQFQQMMSEMAADGFEVGLHASYNSWCNPQMLRREIDRVEQASGRKVVGNRHHYWHRGEQPLWRTARVHAEAGLVYDASAGLERRIGFRNGISTPFHYYDAERERASTVLQLPSCLMDSQLFDYRDLSYFNDPWKEVDQVLKELRTYGGLFLTNFHNRVLNHTFFPGWKEAATHLYNTLAADSSCQVMLPEEYARLWLQREKKLRLA
ncbi:MAG: hypothetical protein COA62_11750 [Rhodobiaceae bacterium]|nr:MAG: hypothetical protein COA62_11750 [Rhodobiaceae bacterium]